MFNNSLDVPSGKDYANGNELGEEDLDDILPDGEGSEEGSEDVAETEVEDGEGEGAEDSDEGDESEEGDKEGKEYVHIPAMLNERFFGGKLNIENLPKDLTREQEAELVGELFQSFIDERDATIGQYKEINQLLQDEEVVEFLKYKQAGRSLKDLVADRTAGVSDDELVSLALQEKFPNHTQEEIDDLIAFYKEKGRFEGIVKELREERANAEAEQIKKANEEVANKKRMAEEAKARSDEQFYRYIESQNDFMGVPLDNKKKEDVYTLATAVNPKTGNLLLEDFLEKDEYVMRAAMGILYLEEIVEALASKKGVKKATKLIDRLYESPEEFNTKKKTSNTTLINYEAANSF